MIIGEKLSGNFLVVIDGTPECESAVRYAARRSELAEKELVVIVAIENQKETHWLGVERKIIEDCLLYTSPSPRDLSTSRMPSSA